MYFAEAGWHNDDGIGVRRIKLATYFDRSTPLTAHFASCRVRTTPTPSDRCASTNAPSHHEYPGVAVETSPGDVIGFDLHTFHASVGGRDRLAWAIEYLAEPRDSDERDQCLRWLADGFEQQYRGFDRERYPTWRDRLAAAPTASETGAGRGASSPSRRARDLPGAEIGW